MKYALLALVGLLLIMFFSTPTYSQNKPSLREKYGTEGRYIAAIKRECRFSNSISYLPASTASPSVFKILSTDLVFYDTEGYGWRAPAGTRTDGASIPDALLWPAGDRHEPDVEAPAIIHDAFCGEANYGKPSFHTHSRPQVSHMFFEACVKQGMKPAKAKCFYLAVYVGGPRWNVPTTTPYYNPNEYDPLEDTMFWGDSLSASLGIATIVHMGQTWIKEIHPALWNVEIYARFALRGLQKGLLLAPPTRVIDDPVELEQLLGNSLTAEEERIIAARKSRLNRRK